MLGTFSLTVTVSLYLCLRCRTRHVPARALRVVEVAFRRLQSVSTKPQKYNNNKHTHTHTCMRRIVIMETIYIPAHVCVCVTLTGYQVVGFAVLFKEYHVSIRLYAEL